MSEATSRRGRRRTVDVPRLRRYRPHARRLTPSLFERVSYRQRVELSRVYATLVLQRANELER